MIAPGGPAWNWDLSSIHVAEHYVSKQGHREATDQVMEAIGTVKTAVEGTNLRIDRMWESHERCPCF